MQRLDTQAVLIRMLLQFDVVQIQAHSSSPPSFLGPAPPRPVPRMSSFLFRLLPAPTLNSLPSTAFSFQLVVPPSLSSSKTRLEYLRTGTRRLDLVAARNIVQNFPAKHPNSIDCSRKALDVYRCGTIRIARDGPKPRNVV